jgi:FkbM family methyltransferase
MRSKVKKRTKMKPYQLLSKLVRNAKERIRYFPQQKIVKINKSYTMLLNPREEGIHRDLFIYKKREPLATDFLATSGILKKGFNVLEAGANIGYYALLEWEIIKPSGVIYALEPATQNYEKLIDNITLNKPNNILPFKLALGDKEGKATLYLSKWSNWCTLNKNNIQYQIGSETTPVTTLDKFLENKQKINFVRMDVEGYEYEILKGSTETLKENIVIQMEVHPHAIKNLEDFTDILEQNDFYIKYAVFGYKVPYNYLIYSSLKKSGYPYPMQYNNITITKLRGLMEDVPACPNVFLAKKGN